MFSRVNLPKSLVKRQIRSLSTGATSRAAKNPDGKGGSGESQRMKKFREKLKSNAGPTPGMELDDLVLVETDPKSGEAVANHEKEPTKWGDWQHGGRVSDF